MYMNVLLYGIYTFLSVNIFVFYWNFLIEKKCPRHASRVSICKRVTCSKKSCKTKGLR